MNDCKEESGGAGDCGHPDRDNTVGCEVLSSVHGDARACTIQQEAPGVQRVCGENTVDHEVLPPMHASSIASGEQGAGKKSFFLHQRSDFLEGTFLQSLPQGIGICRRDELEELLEQCVISHTVQESRRLTPLWRWIIQTMQSE